MINYSVYRLVVCDLHPTAASLWSSRLNIGNFFDEYPSSLQVATPTRRAPGPPRSPTRSAPKAIHAPPSHCRTAPVVRKRFRRVNARVRLRSTVQRRQGAVARRRGRPRQPPDRPLDRPAPGQLQKHAPAPCGGFPARSSARATSWPPAPRGSPCGSPRAAARPHAAPARPALQRDALMSLELNPAEHPHAGPGRADPGPRRDSAVRRLPDADLLAADRVRDRLRHRRAGRLHRAPPREGHHLRQADGPARRQAADHRRAGLAGRRSTASRRGSRW